jgi:hypothetical protein
MAVSIRLKVERCKQLAAEFNSIAAVVVPFIAERSFNLQLG